MKASVSVTTTVGVLVAGDATRSELIIQPRGGDIVIFPYGETGAAAAGLSVPDGTILFLRGPAAQWPINAITASGTVTTVAFGI